MRNLLSTVIAGLLVATPVIAEEAASGPTIGGSIKVDIAENANEDWGSTLTLGTGISMDGLAFGGFNVEAKDGGDFALDEWQMGTSFGTTTVSVGDQGDIWIGAEGEHTIANPKMDESVIVDMGSAAVALEFGDWKNDVSDIEAIAGSFSTEAGEFGITVAGDYDRVTENYTLGGRVDMSGAGMAVTYAEATEKLAYELDSSSGPLSAYLNGDEDDMLKNIGGGYTWDINGLDVEAGANYDIDLEDISPKLTMSFSF